MCTYVYIYTCIHIHVCMYIWGFQVKVPQVLGGRFYFWLQWSSYMKVYPDVWRHQDCLNSFGRYCKMREAKLGTLSFLIIYREQPLHLPQKCSPDSGLTKTIFLVPKQSPGARQSGDQYSRSKLFSIYTHSEYLGSTGFEIQTLLTLSFMKWLFSMSFYSSDIILIAFCDVLINVHKCYQIKGNK